VETFKQKQLVGLSHENAAQIHELLLWLDSAPGWLDTDAAYESTQGIVEELTSEVVGHCCPLRTVGREDGALAFFWDDENGESFVHVLDEPDGFSPDETSFG